MLNRAEREERTRSVRALLRDYLNRTHDRKTGVVITEIPRELLEAHRQLMLLIQLETPARSSEPEHALCDECGLCSACGVLPDTTSVT